MIAAPVRRLAAVADVSLGRQRSPEHADGPWMTPYLRAANVKDGVLDLSDVKEMNFTPVEREIFQLKPGDVLVTEGAGSLAAVGAAAVWSGELDPPVCFQNTLLRLRPRSGTDGRYLAWWARHAYGDRLFAAEATGVNIFHVSAERVRSMGVALPNRREQQSIADFLDAETARIDSLLVLRKRQSELLEERFLVAARELLAGRTAGQCWNPGPWWLGPVDRDWRPNKIAWCKATTSGTTPESGNPAFYDEGGVPWVTTAELREKTIVQTQRTVTPLALLEYSALQIAPRGAVLIAMYGATIGRLGVLGIPAAMNQACCAVYGGGPLDQDFLYWWMLAFRNEIVGEAKGAGQPNISQETVRSLRVPAPALPEQRVISALIQKRHESLERSQAALTIQSELMRERKQALITAAVTGQLDLTRDIAEESS